MTTFEPSLETGGIRRRQRSVWDTVPGTLNARNRGRKRARSSAGENTAICFDRVWVKRREELNPGESSGRPLLRESTSIPGFQTCVTRKGAVVPVRVSTAKPVTRRRTSRGQRTRAGIGSGQRRPSGSFVSCFFSTGRLTRPSLSKPPPSSFTGRSISTDARAARPLTAMARRTTAYNPDKTVIVVPNKL